MQVGYGLVGDLAALAVRLGRQDPIAAAAPALDVGAVQRALYQRRVPGIKKVGRRDHTPLVALTRLLMQWYGRLRDMTRC